MNAKIKGALIAAIVAFSVYILGGVVPPSVIKQGLCQIVGLCEEVQK